MAASCLLLALLFAAMHDALTQPAKPAKDETEEERMLRLEMEALAAEERARTEAVSKTGARPHECAYTAAHTQWQHQW